MSEQAVYTPNENVIDKLKSLVEQKKHEQYLRENPPKQKPIVIENHIGRNDPCSCGSGKKYKKCCLLKDKE